MLQKIFFTAICLFFTACSDNQYTTYKVYPDKKVVEVQAGGSYNVILRIEIPENAHIYANPKGPGTGRATSVNVFAQNRAIIPGLIKYPEGVRYQGPLDKKHVFIYQKEKSIAIPFSVKKSAKKGDYHFKINYSSLMCTDSSCLPKDFSFVIKVIVKSALFSSGMNNDSFVKKGIMANVKGEITSEKQTGISHNSISEESALILIKKNKFIPEYFESASIRGILQAVFFGILAGLILNFMPCVLPVVSLKVLNFVRHAGSDKKQLILQGSFFSLGIIASFMFLAVLAAFFGYNWGDLFQSDIFLIVMVSVVFVLALSMFEVFTINAPSFAGRISEKSGNFYVDAFLKGLLATLLATPCSGPFLGGTLAWALTQPPPVIFIIFMSVGAGMALPYMILTIKPGFIRFIPAPGEWMRTFEYIMGFLLVFTVIYLLSILRAEIVMPTLTFLGFVALGFWQYGKYGTIAAGLKKRILSGGMLLVIIVSGAFLSFSYLYAEKAPNVMKEKEFTFNRLYENSLSGRISIVKFTAEWCPNCKLVEKISVYTDKVIKKVKDNKIDFLVADITRKNPRAENFMHLLGSRSIPFLAVIPPGENFYKPLCLRDIYSESDVLTAIDMALSFKGVWMVQPDRFKSE